MYKVGDCIEMTEGHPYLTSGKKYEVVGIEDDDYEGSFPITVQDDEGDEIWPSERKFRKVEDMTEQETRLKQAQKDRANLIEAADKEIAAIEQEIKDSEVTYSIGDRFTEGRTSNKYILAKINNDRVSMIMISGWDVGNRWNEGATVNSSSSITKSELDNIVGSGRFVRYYDHKNRRTV